MINPSKRLFEAERFAELSESVGNDTFTPIGDFIYRYYCRDDSARALD